jgi:5-methylcytosine-specific restriction enzyme A
MLDCAAASLREWQMPIRDILGHIGENYGAAKAQDFARHPLAAFIRGTAAKEIETALGENGAGLLVVGSAGAGNWAEVPWVSVFDPVVTDSATRGYYVVYLFHSSEPIREVSIHDEAFAAASRLSMMRIMAKRTNAATVVA